MIRVTAQRRSSREFRATSIAPQVAVRPHLLVRRSLGVALLVLAACSTGCYVPLHSPGVAATSLPESFRTPWRSMAQEMNLARLGVLPPPEYILGPGDFLEVMIPGFYEPGSEIPIRVKVSADGTVPLPLVGSVKVAGLNLADAQQAIAKKSSEMIRSPAVNVTLSQKATIDIPVVGQVTTPGVYPLPRYQNDLVHAIASAGGLTDLADEVVEIHRRASTADCTSYMVPSTAQAEFAAPQRIDVPMPPSRTNPPSVLEQGSGPYASDGETVLRIPLRGGCPTISTPTYTRVATELTPNDVGLRPGDVVVIPRRRDEVFYVVGPLDRSNVINFSVQDRDRQLGKGFLLPFDRDIDVVTAVSMAGYIDPIESPSTVTVQRSVPGRPPLLVRVDLIKARYIWQENLYVQAGDIIYLNPDASWWSRRMFDRMMPELLMSPYRETMARWINPFANF